MAQYCNREICLLYSQKIWTLKSDPVNLAADMEGELMVSNSHRFLGLHCGIVGGALAAGLLLGSVAVAQTTQSSEQAGSLGEVVVTAQFKEQKLQDTPIAITAVSAEMIEQHSAMSLSDVTATAPGITFRQQSAAFGNAVTAAIRGFGQGDFNPAYEPGVGLYIDDVYYPRLTGANFDLMDVDRIEILRGPQGTLLGKNSEGGAIRFMTRRPMGEDAGYVVATYGSRDRVNLRGSADFKIADGWSARVSGTYADQRGYVDVIDYGCQNPSSGIPAVGGGTKCDLYSLGDVGYRAMRGILRYNPSSTVDVMLTADYTHDAHYNGAEVLVYGSNANPNILAQNGGAGIPLDSRFVCGQWCNYGVMSQPAASFTAGLIPPLQGMPMPATGGSPLNTYTGYGSSLNIDLGIADGVKLTSITGYRKFTNNFTVDTDLAPTNIGIGMNETHDNFWSEELRLSVKFNDQFNATIGGYYSDEYSNYYSLQDIRYVALYLPPPPAGPGILPIFPLQFIQNDPITTKSKAAFATAAWQATDALAVTGGLRYTKDSKNYTYYRYNLDGRTINAFLDPVGSVYGIGYNGPDTLDAFGGGTVAALSGNSPTYSGSHTDWRVSVDYRFNPAVMVYATAATGYKAGGVGPRPFNAAQAQPFNAETLTSYEFGVKSDLMDRKLRLNAAAFYIDFKDAQLTLLSCPQFGGPGPCALPQNAGNAHVYGGELELAAVPVEGLRIDLSASYLHWAWQCVNPEVVGLAQGPCSSDPSVIDILSSTPPGMAKETVFGGIQYEIKMPNGSTLTPRVEANYQGALGGGVVAPTAGSPSALYGQVPSYTVGNLRLTWLNAKRDLDVAVEVTNFTDKYYFLTKFDLTGAGSGTITGSPARPREWAVTIKKKFGS
jgi:iron complex outermembrane recepter protein